MLPSSRFFPLVCTVLLASGPLPQGDTLTIPTASGPVTGRITAGIAAFKGIPFAAPPVDSLRWRAPRPTNAWKQPLAADDYGASCIQSLPVRAALAGSRSATVSEDCLTLNVWTPAKHDRAMPVMIWIHGGGNDEGTSGRTLYDGTNFAKDGIVLVSFNYRLGILGFFAHPALTRAAGVEMTGNFGLLDQAAAIKWVRRNITAFGGDTNNVTVFGESAGGQDVLALLTSPVTRGLIQKAIAESPGGGWENLPGLADAEKEGVRLATKLGLPGTGATLSQLLAVPASKLPDPGLGDTGPIVDGKLLTETPLKAWTSGNAVHVPLIIGTNSDEGSLVAALGRPADLFPAVLTGPVLTGLRALYGPAANDDAAFTRFLFRDGTFAGPVRWIANHAASAAPVFLYRFDYVVTPFRTTRPGASHGSELPFIFENWPIPLRIPADVAMDKAMHECWVAFAKTGTPKCDGLPGWTAYLPKDGKLMQIREAPAMRDNPVAAVLDRLERVMRH